MSVETQIPYSELSSIKLYVLGNEDNIRHAHVNVVSQDLFRNNLPHPGGIQLPRQPYSLMLTQHEAYHSPTAP